MGNGTERARWIRAQLVGRRKALGLTLQAAADRITAELPGERITKQALHQWESFQTQPRIDHIAAWCRGLGLALRVIIVDPAGDRVETTIPTAFVPLVGAMERLDPSDLAVVASMINRLAKPSIEDSSQDA